MDKLSPWECCTKNTFSQCRIKINREKQIISSESCHNDSQVWAGVLHSILARGHPSLYNEGAGVGLVLGGRGASTPRWLSLADTESHLSLSSLPSLWSC